MKPGKFHEKAEFEIDNAAKTINVAAYYAGDVNTREFHRVGALQLLRQKWVIGSTIGLACAKKCGRKSGAHGNSTARVVFSGQGYWADVHFRYKSRTKTRYAPLRPSPGEEAVSG